MHSRSASQVMRLLLIGLMTLAFGSATPGAKIPVREQPVVEGRLKRDLTYLASDACEGRGPMTRGIDLAADYIAKELAKTGLKPIKGNSYFQPFGVPSAFLDAPAKLTLTGPLGQKVTLQQGVHFWPMGLGSAGTITNKPVVFAGYGITFRGRSLRYDDYAGLDVKGKVVVILRGAPRGRIGRNVLWQQAPFVNKIATARKNGALALLIVNQKERVAGGDRLLRFDYTAMTSQSAGLPTIHLRRSILNDMLASEARNLDSVEQHIDNFLKPDSMPLKGWRASVQVKMHRGKIKLKNVVGVLEGRGSLANETVIIGAHYDHLGYGGGRGSRAGRGVRAIHNGADDNASGTAALLELARRFVHLRVQEGKRVACRRMVFIAFSGEEIGLLGSKYYCKHPLFPLSSTVAMFNLDMVGRMSQDRKTGKDQLLVEGVATSKPFSGLVEELNKKYGFSYRKSRGLPANSDHFPFYLKKIPVLFFWTGVHRDYHRPSDTAEKINIKGMRRIIEISEDVLVWMSTVEERPAYVKIPIQTRRPSSGPRLGIIPGDYGPGGKGLPIDGVGQGGPAALAGLKEGDVIIGIADKKVINIGTYMQAMSGQKLGTTIDVTVLRKGKKIKFKVKLK